MNKDQVEILKDIVTMAASVGMFFIALAGLNAWRRQLKGKEQYDLARRLLVAVFKLRNAYAVVRDPAIWTGEIEIAKKELQIDDKDKAVYTYRWKKVTEVLTSLYVELNEAEALWGKEAREIFSDLSDCTTKLYLAVNAFVNDRKMTEDKDIIYDQFSNDQFRNKVDGAINKIEVYLRKHLK